MSPAAVSCSAHSSLFSGDSVDNVKGRASFVTLSLDVIERDALTHPRPRATRTQHEKRRRVQRREGEEVVLRQIRREQRLGRLHGRQRGVALLGARAELVHRTLQSTTVVSLFCSVIL